VNPWMRRIMRNGDQRVLWLKRKMKRLIRENEVVKGIYNEVVPVKADNQSFWSGYFYRIFKLKQAEEAGALLVKRVISGDEE
jgi:hypothetical protein